MKALNHTSMHMNNNNDIEIEGIKWRRLANNIQNSANYFKM